MKLNPLKDKSMAFAIQIVNICRKIQNDQREYILTKQLLRSGTAIGALYQESQHAESKKDFIHKIAIAQKECSETFYWLELMFKSNILDEKTYNALYKNANELMSIVTSIIKTAKSKL
jgi:four helix bundle protein